MSTRLTIIAVMFVLNVPAACAADAARFDGERLFTTAAQREYLDALRAGTPPPERTPEGRRETVVPPPEAQEASPPPPPVALQGFVRRSDGRSAVWANGQSTLKGEQLANDIRIDSGRIEGSTVVVALPDGSKVRLAPGQIWDPDTSRVVDHFRR